MILGSGRCLCRRCDSRHASSCGGGAKEHVRGTATSRRGARASGWARRQGRRAARARKSASAPHGRAARARRPFAAPLAAVLDAPTHSLDHLISQPLLTRSGASGRVAGGRRASWERARAGARRLWPGRARSRDAQVQVGVGRLSAVPGVCREQEGECGLGRRVGMRTGGVVAGSSVRIHGARRSLVDGAGGRQRPGRRPDEGPLAGLQVCFLRLRRPCVLM